MSTEPKQVPTPSQQMHEQHLKEKELLETNALGQSLIGGWEKFKAGQLISYKWMGGILIAAAAIFLLIYIYTQRRSKDSQLWIDLENANSRSLLEEFAEKNPNTLAANIAQLDLARFLLGPEGIDKLPTSRDETERKIAVDNIDKARELMTKLLDAFKDQPALRVQCLVGMAKSEAAYLGLSKPGSLELLGSVEKLIDWLDKIAEAAGDTPWGEDAKKMSNSLKSGAKTKEEFVEVQKKMYQMTLSPFGGDFPKAPGKTPLDSIPGLPGLDPKPPVPPTPPPIVPEPPKKEEPKPPVKDSDPKPPVKSPDPIPPPKPPEPPKK